MPETIDQYFVQQYQNTIRLLCQQDESRLGGTTIPPVKQEGEFLYWERLGPSEAIPLTTRNQSTPNIEQDHSRRRSGSTPFVWSTLLDKPDVGRMLVDPKGPYQQTAKNAMNRRKDRIILAALGGTAFGGKDGSIPVTLPASQKIAHGSTGLTIGKLLTSLEMLDAAEAPEERYVVAPAAGKRALLNTTEVTNADYNTVKALVSGQVDTFLGFKFIWTELVYLENGSTRTNWFAYAYAKGAVGMGVIGDVEVRLTEESTLNYAWQTWAKMDMGAVRIEEEQVVEINCV